MIQSKENFDAGAFRRRILRASGTVERRNKKITYSTVRRALKIDLHSNCIICLSRYSYLNYSECRGARNSCPGSLLFIMKRAATLAKNFGLSSNNLTVCARMLSRKVFACPLSFRRAWRIGEIYQAYFRPQQGSCSYLKYCTKDHDWKIWYWKKASWPFIGVVNVRSKVRGALYRTSKSYGRLASHYLTTTSRGAASSRWFEVTFF